MDCVVRVPARPYSHVDFRGLSFSRLSAQSCVQRVTIREEDMSQALKLNFRSVQRKTAADGKRNLQFSSPRDRQGRNS